MSYPLFPQRRKLRKWIFALPRVRQQIDQRAIGNRLASQIDQRAIDKGLARKSPLVSSVPLSLLTRHPRKAPHLLKAQSRHRGARSAIASAMRDLCKIASHYAP